MFTRIEQKFIRVRATSYESVRKRGCVWVNDHVVDCHQPSANSMWVGVGGCGCVYEVSSMWLRVRSHQVSN